MDPDLTVSETFTKLGIALALGLLVGMQRERTDSRLAGIRTFPLITMLGTMAGLLALRLGGWIVAAGFVSLAVIVIMSDRTSAELPSNPGITTEVAALLMFGLGAYLVPGYTSVAVVLGGTIAVLLHLKPEMHALARKVGDTDFKAIMQFVLVTLVILPVLPNHEFGPFDILNPFKIWLMVVLIVGISLGGYLAYKFLGATSGSIIAGVLGGLISSTATTVSYARREREAPQIGSMAALVIIIASAVMFLRVVVIVGVVGPGVFASMIGPLATMLAVSVVVAMGMWFFTRKEPVKPPDPENPSELKSAIIFGIIFAIVLLGVAAARHYFGSRGLYVVAGLSGLTDMDAITLSTLELVKSKQTEPFVGWRMILIAATANFVFKGALVATLGDRKLLARIAAPFGIAIAAATLIILLWPHSGN
jgi:uncharacterized membrane protein (DUF4010 family)